ncbi:urease accessory protein UreE domain protein [Corynebacterium efficiens YS-314]|uniref:Urease accessory protein UreE n=1 Tax=Corynebacterium efficiens (strain DSM 44549 / YS-314 / AJ 12310 / JCM 11189 / NBRC 100395) TaxID=196164 RepID=UREE_COREF|nr:urease accessory protein UreE [Corynebacterium efficiens]Q8FQX1.1 RecName: Full=Urease accessory protein UreE [Corynebacterium efficiens YS-314]EEW49872.1 urease accessory protein UreE domain protein [Corynebacterium efficiens YS-314]BAC17806.1 urease accessory protein UreE [Corynebacterium efficiens YS-314]
MIITEIIGNIHEQPELRTHHAETITLVDDALTKRIQRLVSDHGSELGLRLPSGHPPLRDGDVLHSDGENSILIAVAPTDVLMIRPGTLRDMAFVAHSLGNRHLPAQFDGDVMIVRYDNTVVDFLEHYGVRYERRSTVMPTPFRHSEHTH